MFRLNKDMEYALISLVEMSRQVDETLLSARELSKRYTIPYKLLALILQKLRGGGVLLAEMGPRGGYRLAREPGLIRLKQIIEAVRGDERIADCLTVDGHCVQDECGCTIKPLIQIFQDRWMDFVENTTLDKFLALEAGTSGK
ncbi:hypothetical protein S1OALGB6SA_546 [Olavius algarvensis spirochete endosymbiont]|uniref:RrF2 family transcriptional regulator n=1 Tax=Olavius algarvensis spirochete endosymbiont TaxID=260710 RepID=UPI00052D3909|nr:Rrf2 family transcriptional regulator [Olavius algarvensis spirochete endosymbiont]KGM43956.1 hypothetical protein JY97_03870 [Alkalispirochaeta odontotermitis]VDA99478.1 hypothetical protein S1OALGB6SA_546 [Olavius algarvensis spirochete endosymbiont]